MNENKSKQPGDFEIRFLKDGRVVFVGPDQELMDLANTLKNPSADDQERTPYDESTPESTETPDCSDD